MKLSCSRVYDKRGAGVVFTRRRSYASRPRALAKIGSPRYLLCAPVRASARQYALPFLIFWLAANIESRSH
jgi:hypothetical protein